LVRLFVCYMHSTNSVLAELGNLCHPHLHVLIYHWAVHFQTYRSNFAETLTSMLMKYVSTVYSSHSCLATIIRFDCR
jgi:hypothetical protein